MKLNIIKANKDFKLVKYFICQHMIENKLQYKM